MAVFAVACLVAAPAFADPPAPIPEPVLAPLAPGQVIRLGPVAGQVPTGDYGIGATDLCEFMEFPSGILQVCGDSFAGSGGRLRRLARARRAARANRHDQRTGRRALRQSAGHRQAAPRGSDAAGDSQLPAGVVQINRDNYLLITTMKELVPQASRLVKADPANAGWRTVPDSTRPANYQGGGQSQVSGYYDPVPTPDSPKGWVYVVANNFDRTQPVSDLVPQSSRL